MRRTSVRRRAVPGILHQREDLCFGNLQYGALGLHIEAPYRFNLIADELEAYGFVRTGRVEVHDATPDAELAGLVDGILSRVTGLGQEVGECGWRYLLTGREGCGRPHEPLGLREPREQRRP